MFKTQRIRMPFIIRPLLLIGQFADHRGMHDRASSCFDYARELISKLPTPSHETHYIRLEYLHRMRDEFLTFKRLSEQHRAITEILKMHGDAAERIRKDGGGRIPAMYFNMMSYMTMGLRGASVATLVCMAYSVFIVGP
jgi:hypothetical protein